MDENLDLDWSYGMGEEAFAYVCQILKQMQCTRLVEFGSGRSTVRFLQELKPTHFVALEDKQKYVKATREILDVHGLDRLYVREVAIQTVSFTPRWEYETFSLPSNWWTGRIDAAFVDGPAGSVSPTTRGGALHWVWPHLHEQSVVILDDAERPGEQEVLRNWQAAFNITVDVANIGHGLAIIRKG